MNIILIGFMGSGKTTVGKRLAQMLNMCFMDTDEFIEQKQGISIPEIFSQFSEEHFRELEHSAIKELSETDGLVLSTGGGAAMFERNVRLMKESGRVVYLNPGFEECYRRIAQSDRPIVRNSDKTELAGLFARRELLYRAACDIEIYTSGGHQDWADAIISALGSDLS